MTSQLIQVVAYKLGISVEMIAVQHASTMASANSGITEASTASDTVCHVREQLGNCA